MVSLRLALLAVVLGLTFSRADGQETEQNISFGNESLGVLEQLRMEADEHDATRMLLLLTMRLDSLAEKLDRVLTGRLNEACEHRLYWVGATDVRALDAHLRLSSRVRYEFWQCIDLILVDVKTRILQDTKSVTWKLYIDPAPIDDLEISAELTNIEKFPDALERWFDLRVRKDIKIPIPLRCGQCQCSDIVNTLRPRFESARFGETGGAIRVVVTFSVGADLTKLVPCLG